MFKIFVGVFGSTLTLLIQIVKIDTRGIRKIEMVPVEMVVMKSLRMGNLERMGKYVSALHLAALLVTLHVLHFF